MSNDFDKFEEVVKNIKENQRQREEQLQREKEKAKYEIDGYEIEISDKDDPTQSTRITVNPKLLFKPYQFEQEKERLKKLKLE